MLGDTFARFFVCIARTALFFQRMIRTMQRNKDVTPFTFVH